ncbi:MAG: T9SS type A sorting domain-containing protein [Ignavibacterium sp.]|jgi:hypothetical protein|nr:T9SS type A sorting domain-containing protein [Ignavibacterium sp.]
MKKFGLLFFVVLSLTFSSQLSAQNVSPHFSELKGMEDAQGNTHLLYRIYSYQILQPFGFYEDNSLYHFDLGNQKDTLFIRESGSNISAHIYIDDYKIIDFNPIHYIFAGTVCGMECSPFAFNSEYGIIFNNGSWGNSEKIDYAKQKDCIYYGLIAWDIDSSITSIKSYDGGLSWDTLSSNKVFVSVNPFDNEMSFYISDINSTVYKSTDEGKNFFICDTQYTHSNPAPNFYYDTDESHIYRSSSKNTYPGIYYLSISDNKGEPFSWQIKYESIDPIFITIDEYQSGAIYLADGNKIMYSSDYGNTFNLYKELDKKIIGIFKKPNSNKLYAATKYNLYEITNNSITVIKSLPIPAEALDFYPLQIGNKWFYERINYSLDWITGNTIIDTSYFQRSVIGLENKPNGKKYYKIDDYDFYNKVQLVNFERIDSLTGLVFRYDSTLDSTNFECIIDDLMAEKGNQINTSRLYSFYNPIGMIFENEDYFNDWSSYRKRNGFSTGSLGGDYYSLTQGIGLDSVFVSLIDAFDAHIDIKGCVIDGIVYGDTTLTDIIVCFDSSPTSYNLNQNYPNPFNPATKITWQSPLAGHQTLKVYDVLGNEVATLIDEFRNAGIYEVGFDASKLSSGVYFYQLKAGDYLNTKKMLLIR